MSLKAFHLVFVLLSIALSIWFGFWSVGEFKVSSESSYLIYGALSFMSGVALSGYLVYFLKKTRNYSLLILPFLVGVLGFGESAFGCAVCWGDPNHPMTQGANAGVVFLLYVIVALLVGFGGLFLYWIKRARALG